MKGDYVVYKIIDLYCEQLALDIEPKYCRLSPPLFAEFIADEMVKMYCRTYDDTGEQIGWQFCGMGIWEDTALVEVPIMLGNGEAR